MTDNKAFWRLVLQHQWLFTALHQQALCGKNASLSEIMNIVVHNVNYIRKSALSHRQFKNFLAEIESEYPDIPYHCEVRWLSRGYVLKRFVYLRSEIDIFMTEKNRVVTELADLSWLWILAFLVDITQLLNEFCIWFCKYILYSLVIPRFHIQQPHEP